VFGTRPSPRGFAPFLAGALVGLVVNVAITLAGVAFFGTPPVVAKMVGIGVAFLVNFAINAVFVFPQQARGLTGPR
jgi:putative flippase GtrA